MACLFGLAPDGVYRAVRVATSAVGSYPAISTLPDPLAQPSAVYFLWHCSSPRGVRSLTGILLCGARTFLSALKARSDCLASFGAESSTVKGKWAPLKIADCPSYPSCTCTLTPSSFHCFTSSCKTVPVSGFCASQPGVSANWNLAPLKRPCMAGNSASLRLR